MFYPSPTLGPCGDTGLARQFLSPCLPRRVILGAGVPRHPPKLKANLAKGPVLGPQCDLFFFLRPFFCARFFFRSLDFGELCSFFFFLDFGLTSSSLFCLLEKLIWVQHLKKLNLVQSPFPFPASKGAVGIPTPESHAATRPP